MSAQMFAAVVCARCEGESVREKPGWGLRWKMRELPYSSYNVRNSTNALVQYILGTFSEHIITVNRCYRICITIRAHHAVGSVGW